MSLQPNKAIGSVPSSTRRIRVVVVLASRVRERTDEYESFAWQISILYDFQTGDTNIPISTFPTVSHTANRSSLFSTEHRGWKSRRRSKWKSDATNTDDSRNPKLNPNAIHDRKPMNVTAIEVENIDCRDDTKHQRDRTPVGDYGRRDKTVRFDTIHTLSSGSNQSFVVPISNTIGPSFVRCRRRGKFHKLQTIVGVSIANFSPSGRLPTNPSSGAKQNKCPF